MYYRLKKNRLIAGMGTNVHSYFPDLKELIPYQNNK